MWIWGAVIVVAAWCLLSVPLTLVIGRVLGAISATHETADLVPAPLTRDAA